MEGINPMNHKLATYVATINDSIRAWAPSQCNMLSMLRIQNPTDTVGEYAHLPYEVVFALRAHAWEPQEGLSEAAKVVLDETCKFAVTPLQVASLLRFITDASEYKFYDLWNFEIDFNQDGHTWVNVGGIMISHDQLTWRVHYGARQSNLAEAIRTAVTIAALHTGRE